MENSGRTQSDGKRQKNSNLRHFTSPRYYRVCCRVITALLLRHYGVISALLLRFIMLYERFTALFPPYYCVITARLPRYYRVIVRLLLRYCCVTTTLLHRYCRVYCCAITALLRLYFGSTVFVLSPFFFFFIPGGAFTAGSTSINVN